MYCTLCAMSNEYVSAVEAQEVATNYYQKIMECSKENCKVEEPELITLFGKADMWLVHVNESWILVSTDKRTEAILSRFLSAEKPDFKNFPPAAQYLIGCYEHDIVYVRDSCENCVIRDSWNKELQQKKESKSDLAETLPSAVDPLLSTSWKQYGNRSANPECNRVYNMYCPVISTTNDKLCGRAVAGCVAIAVAQIMRYWQWPYAAYVPTTVGGSTTQLKFYDWSLMPSQLRNITSFDEADMTARFIRDCGYDLGMNYGESSGAGDNDALNTLKHFGYDNNISLHYKWLTPGWTNILHTEIAAGRPVYYAGGDGIEGHAFVLDGYDATGLYHVNLGYGESYNNYYAIDTLFSTNQTAIWGIRPDPSYCTSTTISYPFPYSLPKFCVAQAGEITVSGSQMNGVSDGRFYSAESVRLTTGTHINSGCNIQIAIKPVPCTPPISPSKISTNNNENEEQAINEIENVASSPLYLNDQIIGTDSGLISNTYIYSIDGMLLKKYSGSAIPVNSLPNGVYIIRTVRDNGVINQSKIVLQR